jgi:dienelactone hydrolase
MRRSIWLSLCVMSVLSAVSAADDPPQQARSGDALLEEYFEQQVAKLEDDTFAGIETLADWEARRGEYRRELAEMLGLDPMPPKTALQPVVTGTIQHDEFTLEKLHFQSSPGLYVTGSLYLPKGLDKPAPAILYVCGHGRVKEGDVSYGNKATYQHHGIWFARHGYVCLMIDTLQLGEIEGLHHGTYREGMWWWHARGYTPAGVEAWNCIRALDYLETRPEVDPKRFGVTGRSGGGAYSWWIAALDERIQVAVPVAGIASLRNHLLGPFQTSPWSQGDAHGHDGCIEGHCDCMYFYNTYRWDFPMVAALVAPRALLISNTDKDRIFPLDGVYDVYNKTQRIYELYGATANLGLQICEGPHADTQQLRVHAFQWMNRHLKGEEPLIAVPAEKLLEPAQVRVFAELPDDEINTRIHETFVPAAAALPMPDNAEEWAALREQWMTALREQVFGGWPDEEQVPPLDLEQTFTADKDGMRLSVYEYTSQRPYRLSMYVLSNPAGDLQPEQTVHLQVFGEQRWNDAVSLLRGLFPEFEAESGIEPSAATDFFRNIVQASRKPTAWVFLVPRGVGPTAWVDNEKERIHLQRRFVLLGQTLDGMRAWDILRGLQALRELPNGRSIEVSGEASGVAAGWLLTASVFADNVSNLALDDHQSGEAVFLNIDRVLPAGALLILAAENAPVHVSTMHADDLQAAARFADQPWFKGRLHVAPRNAE